jgi:general secretion pathway protein D
MKIKEISKMKKILPAALIAVSASAFALDPLKPSQEMASRLTERIAQGGGIKISALVVGSDDEGVAFVRDDENVDRLVRSGSVVSASLGGIKVDMKVKSVSVGGIELSTPKGGVFLNARFSSLDKTEGADRNFLRYIESESVKLGELVKLISDRSGVNISTSDAAAGKSVSIFLRNITVAASIEEICRTTSLWFRSDGGVIRIMTMEEYQNNLSSFREETMETFTLLYPNVVEVAGVIYGLYPDRTLLSLGEQEVQEDGENDLSRRFRRFRVLEDNGGAQFMGMQAPTVSGSSANTGSGTFSFSRGSALSRVSQWDQLKNNRRRRTVAMGDVISQTQAKKLDEAISSGDKETFDRLLNESQTVANIFVSISRKNNMLIVRTSDTKAMGEIRSLVKKLDVPTPMVLMEVKVMELQLDDDYNATFEYSFNRKSHSMGKTGLLDKDSKGNLVSDAIQSGLSGSYNPTFSFKVISDNVDASIRLMQKDGRIKMLATPTLLTANNEVSRIFSGKEYPIITGWRGGETVIPVDGPAMISVPTPEIERKDIGTMLLITPNINADRTVTIHLLQEDSQVAGKADIPVVNTTVKDSGDSSNSESSGSNLKIDYVESRSLTGTFVAKDNMTVLAGGLIKESEEETFYRTPFLGSIPLLGWLFRGTEKSKVRTELIVLITPHVISTPYEGGKISDELLKALSAHPARDGSKSLGTLRKGKDGVAADHSATNDFFNIFK